MSARLRYYGPAVLVFVGVLVLWEIVVSVFGIQQFLLPRPSAIAAAFAERFDELITVGRNTLVEAVSTAGAESKNPAKDMPIGILGALVICTVLYILTSAVLVGIVPYSSLDNPAPIALAVNQIGRKSRQSIVLTLCPSIFDCDILPLDVAGFRQASVKGGDCVT